MKIREREIDSTWAKVEAEILEQAIRRHREINRLTELVGEIDPRPPFDPLARCPKCRYDAIETKYEYTVNFGERLRRDCARCGHMWIEALATLTTDEPTPIYDHVAEGRT